jgi:transcriptional regulator with XRE-family HTH domain
VDRPQSIAETERFGNFLRKIREDRRYSLDAVAEMSSGYPERITKSHLSRIENGQAIPTFPRLFALSEIYGVPVAQLAERFELDLKSERLAADVSGMSIDDILGRAGDFRREGRYQEALCYYEHVQAHGPDADIRLQSRLQRIACLMRLERYRAAKEECEEVLGNDELSDQQWIGVMDCFVGCCFRLRKYSVARMALERAATRLDEIEDGAARWNFEVTRGNFLAYTGQTQEAVQAYQRALEGFEGEGDTYETSRVRLNLANAMILRRQFRAARDVLRTTLKETEAGGYHRHTAVAYGHLAVIGFNEGDAKAAEAYCLRSNAIARPREFHSLVFRNCYYMWMIAKQRGDDAARTTNERSLRTLLSRIDNQMPEAHAFRVHIAGGES